MLPLPHTKSHNIFLPTSFAPRLPSSYHTTPHHTNPHKSNYTITPQHHSTQPQKTKILTTPERVRIHLHKSHTNYAHSIYSSHHPFQFQSHNVNMPCHNASISPSQAGQAKKQYQQSEQAQQPRNAREMQLANDHAFKPFLFHLITSKPRSCHDYENSTRLPPNLACLACARSALRLLLLES